MKIITAALFALIFAIPAHAVTYQAGTCTEGCQTAADRVADWKEACDTNKDFSTEVMACRVDDGDDSDDSESESESDR